MRTKVRPAPGKPTLLHGRCHASELFVAIFGGVVAMKKGGKK